MSSKALLWSRIALCFISVAFLLLYTSQYSTYRMQYSKILQKYSESVVHSDGLAAQLRVMVERNERVERLMAEMRAKQSIVMKGNLEKYRELESAKMACSESFKKCNEEMETLRSSVNEKTNEVVTELRAELQRAQKKIADLEIERQKCLNKEENKTMHDTKVEAEANNKIERQKCLNKEENKTMHDTKVEAEANNKVGNVEA
uniref:Protein CASP n=1 Tax=Ascaris lumbricoides TaxID=6252 RepID=A0A9J2PG36_ASCLU